MLVLPLQLLEMAGGGFPAAAVSSRSPLYRTMGLGLFRIDDNLTFYVGTLDPATGAVSDADSDPTYRVYEEETGTPLLTGTMSLLDDLNTTGFYSEQITLSAANGFELGKCYGIRINATVGGVSGTDIQTFTMGASLSAFIRTA